MKSYQHIVIGIDFSEACKLALKSALRYARLAAAPVTACHVVSDALAEDIKHTYHYDEAQLKGDVASRVLHFIQSLDHEIHDLKLKIEVSIGHPVKELATLCEREGADLLVLGTLGNEQTGHYVGAIASKCVRNIPINVLLVREDAPETFNRMLCCVDFSETSTRAVAYAAYLADLEKAALDCLFVHQSPMSLTLDAAGFLPPVPAEDASVVGAMKNKLAAMVEAVMVPYPDLQRRHVVVEHANIRQAVIEYILVNQANLVVIGTHSHSLLRDFLLGTTAETILQNAPCSILLIRPEQEPDAVSGV